MPIGLSPRNADDVNLQVGTLLRQFVTTQEGVTHFQNWLAPTDISQPPYSFDPTEAATIKSAISGLNASLQAVDMVFINRLTGLFV
jgi:hypothetical protein